jgi:hypothetical protein
MKIAKQEKATVTESAEPSPERAIEAVEMKSKDAPVQTADYPKATGAAAPVMIGGVKKETVAEEAVTNLKDSAGDIVSFAGDSSANKAMKGSTSAAAEPLGGRKEFDRYAEEHIRIPSNQKAGDEKIVVIEFIVKENGEYGAFKVIRSPSVEYSSEAERLIKEGPSWKPAVLGGKSIESKVRLRIVFKRD